MFCLSVFTLSIRPVAYYYYYDLRDRSLSFFHSFFYSVNRITDERGNGRRPNLAGTGKRWPSRSDWLLVVIRICAWIPDHFFIFFTTEESAIFWHLLAFLRFLNSRFVPYLAKWLLPMTVTNASTILGRIRRTSGSILIRKYEFESRITFVSNFGVGGGLHSLSDLTDFQNAVACNGYNSMFYRKWYQWYLLF